MVAGIGHDHEPLEQQDHVAYTITVVLFDQLSSIAALAS